MSKKQQDVRFGKFGTVSFTKTTMVNDFIDHLENGKVMYTKCKSCGKSYFPPRAHCGACLGRDTNWLEVSGHGKLVSCSRLEYAPVGFEADVPYTIALVDFGDYRVFGRLDENLDLDAVTIGMALNTEARTLPNGQLTYCFTRV